MALVKIRANYQITLPAAVRRQVPCKVGDYLEVTALKGRIILAPKKMIDKDQAWFWEEAWQAKEKEALQDFRQGRVAKFDSIQDLLLALDS